MMLPLLAESLMGELALPLFLVAVGLVLIFLEVYIPSAGLMGFLSALAMVTAIVLAFRAGENRDASWVGWAFLFFVVFLVPVVLSVALRTLPHTPMGKRLILDGRPPTPESQASNVDLSALRGKSGVAITDLRPAGRAEIEGQRHDVSSDGAYIASGTAIVVHHVEGNRIFVRPAPPVS